MVLVVWQEKESTGVNRIFAMHFMPKSCRRHVDRRSEESGSETWQPRRVLGTRGGHPLSIGMKVLLENSGFLLVSTFTLL